MENPKPKRELPDNAKRVFNGVLFEVWQWEQEMFDGTTATFEKVWRCPTVEIIATVGDKIIIEKQDQPDRKGNINFPSGQAKEDDDLLEEAKRELLEETGYISEDWNLLEKFPPDGKVLHEVDYFVARDCQKIQEPELDSGEKIKIEMITFDELLLLADEPKFWVSPKFINLLLRARFDENAREELRKGIFEE